MKKLLLLLPIAFMASCTYEKGEVPVKDTECDSTISYSTVVAPLITTHCNACHVSGGTGTGDFTTYAGLKQKADNGTLRNRVVVLKDMPQAGYTPTMSDEDRNLINCWIKQGALEN
jgi:uncharacterized membrane protein